MTGDPREAAIISPAEVEASPWINGAGQTRVLHTGEAWRVSVAEILGAAPFSRFPGMARTLIPLTESGVNLRVGGSALPVAQFHPCDFSGEEEVSALGGSPATVLNVMIPREAGRGRAVIRKIPAGLAPTELRGLFSPADSSETVLLGAVVLGGEVRVAEHHLPPGTLVLPEGIPQILIEDSTLVFFFFTPKSAAGL